MNNQSNGFSDEDYKHIELGTSSDMPVRIMTCILAGWLVYAFFF